MPPWACEVKASRKPDPANSTGRWMVSLFKEGHAPKRALFRVDAGSVPGLSFGHLSRCLVMARAFQQCFWCESLFLMRDYDEGVSHAKKAGKRVITMPAHIENDREKARVLKAVKDFRADLLVVDLPYPEPDTSYYRNLRRGGTKIIFIDDSRYISPPADVILNSNILAQTRTPIIFENRSRYLLGPEYFIFDVCECLCEPQKRTGWFNVVVTFGGSDPCDLTVKVLSALSNQSWPEVWFTIVLGPGYQQGDRVDPLLERGQIKGEVLKNPPALIPLLLGSDLTLCGGGRTMYELLYLDKPLLALSSAPHESEGIREFLRQGWVRFGFTSWDKALFLSGFRKIMRELMKGK